MDYGVMVKNQKSLWLFDSSHRAVSDALLKNFLRWILNPEYRFSGTGRKNANFGNLQDEHIKM
jgi:hypothetical protein